MELFCHSRRLFRALFRSSYGFEFILFDSHANVNESIVNKFMATTRFDILLSSREREKNLLALNTDRQCHFNQHHQTQASAHELENIPKMNTQNMCVTWLTKYSRVFFRSCYARARATVATSFTVSDFPFYKNLNDFGFLFSQIGFRIVWLVLGWTQTSMHTKPKTDRQIHYAYLDNIRLDRFTFGMRMIFVFLAMVFVLVWNWLFPRFLYSPLLLQSFAWITLINYTWDRPTSSAFGCVVRQPYSWAESSATIQQIECCRHLSLRFLLCSWRRITRIRRMFSRAFWIEISISHHIRWQFILFIN